MERFDCHCHIFNIVDVGLKAILEELTSIKELLDEEESENKRLIPESAKAEEKSSFWEKIRKMAEMIKIFTGDSETILETLDHHYDGKYKLFPLMFDGDSLLDDYDDDELSFIKELSKTEQHASALANKLHQSEEEDTDTILQFLKRLDLLVDERKAENEYTTGFQKQYNQIKEIKAKPEYADKVFPFLGVDPRNEKIKDYLPEIGNGKTFAGVKVYPPNGFSPCDPALVGADSIFEYCSKNYIPIISHCSYGGFATPVMDIDVNGMIIPKNQDRPIAYSGKYTFDISIKDGFSEMVRERAGVLNHPLIWEEVLKLYPNLILVLAHFGVGSTDWQEQILRMLKTYPNLYTDVSCISDQTELQQIKNIYTENTDIQSQILYGSDYFLGMFFNDSFDDYLERMQSVFGQQMFDQISSKNPTDFMAKWYTPIVAIETEGQLA